MNANEPAPTLAFSLPFTKAADPNATFEPHEYRLPLAHKIPDAVRNHFVAMCGEFVGTVLFLYFALSGTQVANGIRSSAGLTVGETGANPQQLQYIALCFGFSLAVNAWVFFRISGGLFNPAVTLGMCLIGALPWFRGCLLFVSQILGGIVAAALVSCMFPGDLNVHTTLGGGTSVVQGLFIEMILTAQLVFTIFMLAAEKHKGTFIAPVGIGLSLFIAELTGVYFTGGSLNPARSFGPAVVDRRFDSYHWIYWLGPVLGALVAAGFFKFIKVLEYETANPGQDANHAARIAAAAKAESNGLANGHDGVNGTHQPLGVNLNGAGNVGNYQGAPTNSHGYHHDEKVTTGAVPAHGATTATGFGAATHRPEARRNESSRIRSSGPPRVGSVDDTYYGLENTVRPGQNSRTVSTSQIV